MDVLITDSRGLVVVFARSMVFSKILAQLIGTELEEAVSMLPLHKNNIVLQLVLAANAVVHEVEGKISSENNEASFPFFR